MPPSAALVEQQHEFDAKQAEFIKIMDAAKDGARFDLSRKTVQELLGATDETDAGRKLKDRNSHLEALGLALKQAQIRDMADQSAARADDIRQPWAPVTHSGPDRFEAKTLGDRYILTKEFAESRARRQSIPATVDVGLKTLFQTSAGFAPESIRTGQVVEAVTRPIQVLDLIPSRPIGQATERYMEQTTRTHAAAERAEGAAYAESTFVYTERTSDVRSIGDSIPVTDEQLEDESQVAGLLDQQLRFGVMQRLDGQILTGNGTPPNLRGINNVVGIQVQAKGADATIVAFMRALTLIRITGRAQPNGAIFHPNDWLDILLTQNANGDYLFGNPFQGPGPRALFGIPIAESDAQTQNTGLVGDFLNFCRLSERKGVEVEIGYTGSQFVEGKRTLRATARAAFTVYRPTAFCQITGI